MDRTLFLAEFWGWFLIIFFFIIIVNTKRIVQMFQYIKDEKLLFVISFIAIIIGLVNILLHNIWTSDWRIIITLFGWIALFKGIVFFSFPDVAKKKIMQFQKNWVIFILIFLFFMGLYLLNKVYFFLIY